MSGGGLPRVGDVLDLAPDEWSLLDDRRLVVPADWAARVRVDRVDPDGAEPYGGRQVWVFGVEVDANGQPGRVVRALVPVRGSGVGECPEVDGLFRR